MYFNCDHLDLVRFQPMWGLTCLAKVTVTGALESFHSVQDFTASSVWKRLSAVHLSPASKGPSPVLAGLMRGRALLRSSGHAPCNSLDA